MIELLEGVPGSGKSYYAVSERLLKWVRAGRRIYVFVEGFYLDRLALFEGIPQADLERQITIWNTGEEVKAGLCRVEPGSAVLLDEVQTLFRAKDKTDPELLRWLETHRHRGIDVVMMCQQYGQVTLGVNRLVEATTKFRRLDRFGLKNRYQASVRGNPEETEVIRMFTGKYDPALYAYYSSYASGAIRETARGGSILKSPTLLVGLVGFVLAIWWFAFGGWISGAKPAVSAPGITRNLPHREMPAANATSATETASITPIRIQGGIETLVDGQPQWLYISERGDLLTSDEIALRSGGIVNARMDHGSRVLYGSGVIWGGRESIESPVQAAGFPTPTIAQSIPTESTPAEVSPPPVSSGVDLLATPPDLR